MQVIFGCQAHDPNDVNLTGEHRTANTMPWWTDFTHGIPLIYLYVLCLGGWRLQGLSKGNGRIAEATFKKSGVPLVA